MRKDAPKIMSSEEDARLYAAIRATPICDKCGDPTAIHPKLCWNTPWWKKALSRLKLGFAQS